MFTFGLAALHLAIVLINDVQGPVLIVVRVFFNFGQGPVLFWLRSSTLGSGVAYCWPGSCLFLARAIFTFGFDRLDLVWVVFTLGLGLVPMDWVLFISGLHLNTSHHTT